MDISSMYTNYLDQTSTSTTATGAERAANTDYSNASDEELLNACKKFENYFVEQVLKEMQKTVPENEDEDSSTSQLVDYYKDNMTSKIAEQITDQGNLGLAQQMYEQMKRNYQI